MSGRVPVRHAATVDGPEPVLLATKLHPRAARTLVPRPRLLERLRPTEHRLTVLAAPAGWGKTSLLAQWYATMPGEVAWLALEAADDDPVLFWSYLIAALRTRAPGIGERALAALGAGERALREAGVPSLVNELLERPERLVLVLDDYHVITAPAVHESLALLLDHLPPHVHLVVAARGDPLLPLGRLRAAGELSELRTDELALTDAEVAAVLARVPGLDLSDADAQRLARRTEGWPTGLSLAAASLAGRGGDTAAFIEEFTGTDRYVLDYLCREVINQLPADECAFLLRTSVLDRLNPALCTAVTGRSDAAAVLDRFDRAGVFLMALDPGRRWYRHHRLFGELLRHELALAEPALVPELHSRAAWWWAANGSVGDAVTHHVAAGDGGAAAELVAQHWNESFNAGRRAAVTGWLDLLPATAVRADHRLCAARAWSALDLGLLDDVDDWVSAGDLVADPADRAALRDLAVLRSAHRFKIGDVAAAGTAARRVLELGDGEVGFAATVAQVMAGVTAYWDGDAASARRLLAEAVRLARRTRNVMAEAYALGYLALAAEDSGALADAARVVALAAEKAADLVVAEHFVAFPTHLAQALLSGAGGRTGPAHTSATRALELAKRGAGRMELAFALAVRAQAAAAAGGDGWAWLEQARRLARECPAPGHLHVRLARVRLPARTTAARAVGPGDLTLSDRERDLLPLLAGTLSQREIGGVLHLSLNTVKTHTRGMFRKLGVSSRVQAVERARALGLL